MAKKMKLKLEDLKVHSFVTTLNKHEEVKLKGGLPPLPESGGEGNSFYCSAIGCATSGSFNATAYGSAC